MIFFPSQILLKIILDGCPKLKGSILSSALLCMVDIVYDNSKNYGISFAKEKTSENKGVCKRKTSWIKNWNSFPWWDSNLQNLDCSLTLIQEPKFLGKQVHAQSKGWPFHAQSKGWPIHAQSKGWPIHAQCKSWPIHASCQCRHDLLYQQRTKVIRQKRSKVVKAHNFMPDLKVGRIMPVVVDHTTLLSTKNKIVY